jgi:isoleucyl-tRNA synthetase
MDVEFPKLEQKILRFWKDKKIFERSLEKKGGDFVFYEGPPTANGKPGIHHILARTFKDVVCRYQTMQGKRVLRKAGWDVHGLPVELEVEKQLGLKNKKEVEEYGLVKFNEECKQSVWNYTQEWKDLTERIGYWVDLKDPYITSDPLYMESTFNIIKTIADKGLLYEGHKVMPYCPRCGTGLSSHEVAQGYKKVSDPAVYVKFKTKLGDLLVWTTTPWTLPANVAIAVNSNIDYVLTEDNLILAKARLEVLENHKIVREFKGEELVGQKYESLFSKEVVDYDIDRQILSADFVTTTEGTGLVHIAPAFGQDDMQMIKETDLPVIVNVDEQGNFKEEVKPWAGLFVKDADPKIIDYLRANNILFKSERYEHDYPFCWRCKSPLLYYAKESWFIKTTDVKEQLIKNNKTINWIPSHIQEGRFGEWLNELKDWALSRERYWGTPLPVWKCTSCTHQEVIGSRDDLSKQKFSTNKYLLLRHGQADSNVNEYFSSFPEKKKNNLTSKGKKQIEKHIKALSDVDIIISSDVDRVKQSAEIIANAINKEVIFDERLREVNFGDFNGAPIGEVNEYFDPDRRSNKVELLYKKYDVPYPEGESGRDVKIRLNGFIKDIDSKYKEKKILIVSHGGPLFALNSINTGTLPAEDAKLKYEVLNLKHGSLRDFEYKQMPLNEGEIDFHRPFIDEVSFMCPKCSAQMKRVSEVIDCWFDSGSMPFSQRHWPFNDKEKLNKAPQLFPADYISEGIDQTRGWFYTLLAISTLLGFESPYKSVIATGHILDEKGEKMSKSKGNIVNPWDMLEKYGADAVRWYFFTINQPGDPKLFKEADVDQSLKKFILTFWNSYKYLKMYDSNPKKDNNILDDWILSKLHRLTSDVTEGLNKYDLTTIARKIENFTINDLSLWYIRRSRSRLQKGLGINTLKLVLIELSKITAPFIPFLSEEIYKDLTGLESVHLESWPKSNKKLINDDLEKDMDRVREMVGSGLKIRNVEGLKVRQPLSLLQIKGNKINSDLLPLIMEELNVKQIEFVDSLNTTYAIDQDLALKLEITPELKEEGMIRETTRQIQIMRKNSGCKPENRIIVYYFGHEELIKRNKDHIISSIKADELINQKLDKSFDIEKEFELDGQSLWLALKIKVK